MTKRELNASDKPLGTVSEPRQGLASCLRSLLLLLEEYWSILHDPVSGELQACRPGLVDSSVPICPLSRMFVIRTAWTFPGGQGLPVLKAVFCVSAAGIAYLGGVCSAKRKCVLAEDNGLNLAFTIAHELGHK